MYRRLIGICCASLFYSISAQGQSNVQKKDPCALRSAVSFFQNNEVTKLIAVKILGLSDGIEWGTNHNLAEIPVKRTLDLKYKSGKIKNSITDTWEADFNWNSREGYTIGRTYLHPGGAGPSPDDVFAMLDQMNRSPDLLKSQPKVIDYYKNNVFTTILTKNETYVVMIKDWDELEKAFGEYNKNRKDYLDVYARATNAYKGEDIHPDSDIGEASSFALLMLLNKAIVLFKAAAVQENVLLNFKLLSVILQENKPIVQEQGCLQ